MEKYYDKKIVKKALFGCKVDSNTYVEHLKKSGAKIGDRVRIFEPRYTQIDETRPWLLDIGDDVQITYGVTILTHGYDWSVLKGVYGEVLGSAGKVKIGNNVFIGMHTTILKGVTIGDNVIIGANSLVNKDVESGWVVAGNPAKPIMRVEDYYEKRKSQQLAEAKELYDYYCRQYGKEPEKEVFDEFFWLFEERKKPIYNKFFNKMSLVGNCDIALENFLNSAPKFNGYDEFLVYLRDDQNFQR